MARIGFTVPMALATCATAARRVRGPWLWLWLNTASSAPRSSSPSSVMGTARSMAPRSRHSICHGTRFEWCSMVVTSTSSPGARRGRAKLQATRFNASVAPRTKTISRGSRAFTNRAAVARARSYAAVARSDSSCTPRWTLARLSLEKRATAWITAAGTCVVAALSR
jgi:hypothetical protein